MRSLLIEKKRVAFLLLGSLVACSGGDDSKTDQSVASDLGVDSAIELDLAGADLAGEDLSKADLTAADLTPPGDLAESDAGFVNGYDFRCSGQVLPTTAPAMIDISGNTQRANGAGLPAVMLSSALRATPGTSTATTTSFVAGAYLLTTATGGVPFDGFVRGSISGYVSTNVFPASPATADWTNATVTLWTTAERDALYATGTGSGANASKGMRYSGATGNPSAGATVTNTDGRAWGFDETAGATTASAMYAGVTLRTVQLFVNAAEITEVEVRP